jgi:hypothetical protein
VAGLLGLRRDLAFAVREVHFDAVVGRNDRERGGPLERFSEGVG